MTPPSTATELEHAKAALKQQFIDMLVKKDYNTAKIEKLLAESPQFKALLSASAADVVQQAKAMGHADNATTRSTATKIAEMEAQKLISQLRVSAGPELKTRIETGYLAIEGMKQAIRDTTGKCDGALAAMLDLNKYEFLRNPASKDLIKIKFNEAKVSKLGADMNGRHDTVAKLQAKLDAVVSSDDETALRDALRSVEKQLDELRTEIKKTTEEVGGVLRGLTVEIKQKPLEAYIATLVKDDIEKFEKAVDFVDKARKYATAVFKASEATNTLNRAFDLLTTVAKAAGKSAIVGEAGKQHMKSHTDAEVRAEHTKDPLLLAKAMFEQQKTALKIFLQGLGTTLSGALIAAHGAGEIVMKVWDPVADSIQEVLATMLEARLRQAEDALAAKDAALAKQLQTDREKQLEKSVTDAIREKVEEFGKEVGKEALKALQGGGESGGSGESKSFLEEIAEDPEKLVTTVLKWVLKPVLKKVWEIFPPKPAEAVTGDDLDKMQSKIVIAQLPIGMGLADRVAPGPRAFTPMTDQPEDIDPALWSKFLSVDAGRTSFPADAEKRSYYVAMKVPGFGDAKVWGYYDPRTKVFSPAEIDGGSLEDWSGRTVAGAGYSDGPLGATGPAVRGTWALVSVGSYNYVGLIYGDKVHWGHRLAPTVGGLGTQLGPVVERLEAKQDLTMEPVSVG